MIKLTGSNLGERQRELNTKVKEAAALKVNFNEIKDTAEGSDVDKLFKIDLASEYYNSDYIIEVLKSGDSLYISRALKCSWIFQDSYSDIINVNNLHNNIIPFMSNKMKKKLLTAVSIHVRTESRVVEFYKYCMDNKLTTIALKFLNFTNDTFKLEVMKDKSGCKLLMQEYGSEAPKHFIGASFPLAEAYVKAIHKTDRIEVFQRLSYLYTVSGVKYLDLLEKYIEVSSLPTVRTVHNEDICFGLRISNSIMKQHKDRVLKKPSLYVKILSKAAVARYSTAEDAKIYLPGLLPNNVECFWSKNFCSEYEYIIDKIKYGKFQFIKKIFTAKYPEEDFETVKYFYNRQCYVLMTTEEKEIWALEQIANENEILGIGKEFLWYKFVNFDKSFEEIKKLLLIATDDVKRAEMMFTLLDSAKTHRDARKLMKYYYEKHGNEHKFMKENFVDRILHDYNVFEFDKDCWTAFNKMLHNLQVYHVTNFNSKGEYRLVALIHCTINQKEVPQAVLNQLDCELQFYPLKTYINKLTDEQKEIVFEYLLNFYMDEIRRLASEPYMDQVKHRLRKYIHFILDLLDQFDKTKENIPELVDAYMKLDCAEFEYHRLIRDKTEITKLDLFRDLKTDAKLLVEHLPLVKENISSNYRFHMSTVFKKLKTYFSHDIAKEYLNFFYSLLAEDQLWLQATEAAAHGIFQLGDEKCKVDFMTKYAPKGSGINHSEIDEKLLRVQQAICAHAYYSRPPVPLKTMLLYVKLDYVHFCLPMFHSYLANLPLPLCLEFVESIIDAPVSIQKHGIRLAFECFNAESLNTLALRVWKKNKNISLRMIIYKGIFNKISKITSGQDILFDTLKQLTLTLRPDDDDEVFGLLKCCKIPDQFLPDCIEITWKVINQFPPKSTNLARMNTIIMFMCNKIDIMRHEFVCGIIESFIATVFDEEENEIQQSPEAGSLIDAKWKLAATYIINVKGDEDIGKKTELTKLILTMCLKNIGIREKSRHLLKTCFSFIYELESRSYHQDFHHYDNANKVMQLVLETLEEMAPIQDIYMVVWDIRLGLVARKVIAESKIKYADQEKTNEMKETANNFANELGNLVEEFVEKELFFDSFHKDIHDNVVSKMQTVRISIDSAADFTEMKINVCLGLLSFELPQSYLLVLNLLPESCRPEYMKEYEAIIKKISDMNDLGFRCNLKQKLYELDFDAFVFM